MTLGVSGFRALWPSMAIDPSYLAVSGQFVITRTFKTRWTVGRRMRGISALAIIVGGVCDVVLSAILGVPLVIYAVSAKGLSHIPKEQVQDAVMTAIHGSPMLYAVQLVTGLGCSVIGGFVAASIAKERRILNGVLASWLCVGLGVYSVMFGRGTNPLPFQALLIAITPLCYFVGARLKRPRVPDSGGIGRSEGPRPEAR